MKLYIFRKKNLFIEEFEKKILDMVAFGIIEKITSLSVPDVMQVQIQDKLEPLTLEHFVLAFISLFGLLALAVVVFLMEVIV